MKDSKKMSLLRGRYMAAAIAVVLVLSNVLGWDAEMTGSMNTAVEAIGAAIIAIITVMSKSRES